MRDSLFYSSFRALFVSLFAIIGICLGFMVFAILINLVSSDTSDSRLTPIYTEEILPNAKGERSVVSSSAPVILQINITGIIGTEELDTKTVRQQLVESREGSYKNDRVKGLLLYIDSPGGTVVDAAGIFDVIMSYKEKYKVPVYAFVDGLCASGGMYVALAADKVFASDVSLIGSVGVIAPSFINVAKLLEKIGVDTLTISAGKDKDAMNPLRPWKNGEQDNYVDIINYYYNDFVKLVTTHRPTLTLEKLTKDYGARIFPAAIALQHGYIDVSGADIHTTLTELLKHVGIADDNYQFIRLESKAWWKGLIGAESPLFTGKVKHELSLSPAMDLLMQNKFLYLYHP